MNIAWLNNSNSPTGGTLQCTHSMIAALPDCSHTVYLRGKAHQPASDLFKGIAEVRFESSLGQHDLVICQNTPKALMPKTSAVVIYYLHSQGGMKDFDGPRLAVSRWLAERVGWGDSEYLHQPVSLPPGRRPAPKGPIRLGRICTPTERKWKPQEWLPHMKAVRSFISDCEITLVGCPQSLREDVAEELPGVVFLEPGVDKRSLLWEWDVLLYTAELPESFGRVVREAQRCGCFPVVSRRGGFIEQIARPGATWEYGTLVGDDPEEAGVAVKTWADADEDFGYVKEHGDATGSLQAWRAGFLKFLGETL